CTTKNCALCDNNNACTKCIDEFQLSSSKACFSATNACGDGQYGTAGNCQDCKVTNCKKCSTDGNSCSECTGNYMLDPSKTKCAVECPQNSFSNNQICYKCTENCAKCSGESACDECESGIKIKYEGKCYKTCPDHTFEAVSGVTCEVCKESYTTPCKEDDKECIKCTTKNSDRATLAWVLALSVAVLMMI
ncbi:insect antifreeze protein, partial [Entamoeba invadens IP1]